MKPRAWFSRRDAWPRPQFLPVARPVAWVWWMAAAASALAFGLALSEHRELRAQAAAQREAAAQWQRRSAPRAVRSADTGDMKTAKDAAARVASAIAYPWPGVISAIEESTVGGIQWIASSHAIADAAVRLEGEAARTEDALAVVDKLSSREGWSSVALARIEAPDAKAAGRLRFEIVAKVGRMAVERPAP